ncbi:MAG: RNA methyltransferase [Muribaculum sp.]|nr:RNA methyltransferase [Muribaculaceae bacterium]MCM1081479.1 RNA methyltransferase [Muribaculum sp.]
MTNDLTAATRKFVASLGNARQRRLNKMFTAEGSKCVADTLPYFNCRMLLATHAWLEEHAALISKLTYVYKATRADMDRMSQLATASDVIAVYDIPDAPDPADATKNLVLALDRVQDPGNMGTIIRVADWFGIRQIVCSPETADAYNPKVIQATMGAIARVRPLYIPLADYFSLNPKANIYGTFLDGENIYTSTLSATGIIVMGNEGRGISDEVARLVNKRLLIPSYPAGCQTSESLNVATATAITLSEFRRRINV